MILTFIGSGRVRPQHRLRVAVRLELGQDGAGDLQAGDHVILGQLEPELLGVVVHNLDIVQLEGDETLISSRQGLLGLTTREGPLDLGLGLLRCAGVLCEVVIAAGGDCAATEEVQQRVVAPTGGSGGLVGITADLLAQVGVSNGLAPTNRSRLVGGLTCFMG